MKKYPIKTHPMWNPSEPTYADVGDVVGKAFQRACAPILSKSLCRQSGHLSFSKSWCATPCASTLMR